MPKIKNIIIFVAIGAVFAFIYFYFIKSEEPASSPVSPIAISSPAVPGKIATPGISSGNVARDFLTLLLSVRSIKLDDTIFADVAFESLDGTHSITLVPDGNEGRPNPFAPLGAEVLPPAGSGAAAQVPAPARGGAPVTP